MGASQAGLAAALAGWQACLADVPMALAGMATPPRCAAGPQGMHNPLDGVKVKQREGSGSGTFQYFLKVGWWMLAHAQSLRCMVISALAVGQPNTPTY